MDRTTKRNAVRPNENEINERNTEIDAIEHNDSD